MMNVSKINAEQAGTYFEKAQEYYTKHMTSYDRWQGTLAKTLGLKGELTKEQFDKLTEHLESVGRKNPAYYDCTFSAVKSVSLLQADPRYRDDMIAAHQAAVRATGMMIEAGLLGIKVRHEAQGTHNAIMAGFLHQLARPTEENGFVPDPDLHTHLLIANMSIGPDGKEYAIDARKLMNERTIKEYGLRYRQQLAAELQKRGYELEVTDAKRGFFEVKGFTRDIIMEYSHREKEVLATEKEKGVDRETAKTLSRTAKDKATEGQEEIFAKTKAALFDSGRVKVKKGETINEREHEIDESRGDGRSEIPERRAGGGLQDFASNLDRTSRVERYFAEQAEPRLSDVQERGLDVDEKRRSDEPDLLLSRGAVERLAECQAANVRSVYVREARAEQRRERLTDIDRITAEVIEEMTSTDYAIALPNLRQRIRAAAVLLDLSDREIDKAIDRAGLVAIGRKLDASGKPSKDRYLAPKDILETEPLLTQRVKDGKNAIMSTMDIEAARAALAKVEDFDTQRAHGVKDGDLFEIAGGEQGEAVCHVLTCKDRYLAIDGLAGTGKTTLMQRLKWIADDEGIEVRGLCFTGKAAAGLQDESGIQSTTIHSFLNALEKQSGIQSAPSASGEIKQTWDFSKVKPSNAKREIWVVDEAGLVDMRLMDQLQKAAEARNAQIVFSGDPKQLPPVGVGEPLRDMEAAGMATAFLTEIRRQRKADEDVQKAVRESVAGDTAEAVKLLEKRGDFREIKETADRRAAIVREMTKEPFATYRETLLLVSRNADRVAYNKAIRAEYVKRGDIEQGEAYEITVKHPRKADTKEVRNFAAGDRIIFKANDKKLGVKNGEMASIKSIDGSTFVAVKDNGENVKFGIDKYSTLDHSYAVTNYAAQGMTVRKVVADMDTRSAKQTRNSFYVDISRTKKDAIIFTNDKSELSAQVSEFATKARGRDFERVGDIQRRGVQGNDFYKTPERTLEDRLNRALRDIEAQTQHVKEQPTAPQLSPEAAERQREAEALIQSVRDRTQETERINNAPQPKQEKFVMPEPHRAAPEAVAKATASGKNAEQDAKTITPSATASQGTKAERPPQAEAAERPQDAHEDERIRADERPEPAKMSTSRGISENQEEKEPLGGRLSPSGEAMQPSIPPKNRENPASVDIQKPDEPPAAIEISATATVEEAEEAIRQNIEMRTALYNKTRAEVAPQFDLWHDPKYQDIQRRAAAASGKSYEAGEAAKKAAKERGDKFQAWQRAQDEDSKHEGFFSSIGYTKQAPEARKAFAKAQDAEDAANRRYDRASEEAIRASSDLHDYQTGNEYRIREAVKRRAPRLADYDRAIEKAREHVRTHSRTREREATYTHNHH